MGAGRKTTTFFLKEKSEDSWKVNNSNTPARNLSKVELGAIIFGCKHSTIKECLEKELFGLPAGHYPYVRKATPGLTLFLFNYSDRKLHGIFEAVTPGHMNIDPKAWITSGEGTAATTPYPAQVWIRAKGRCRPLLEEEMKPIIANNYYEEKLFWFELDKEQTKGLTALFQSSPWPEKALRPSNANWNKNNFNVPWRPYVIKAADEKSKDVDSEQHFGMTHSISYSDSYSPGKKWSELFKPSSSSSAVNNAEVVKPDQNVLSPFTSECIDSEWESAAHWHASSELPPPEVCNDAANAECDSFMVECWEDNNLVDDHGKEILDNCVQYQDEGATDMPSSENTAYYDGWGDLKLDYVPAEETLIDTKANNEYSIPLAPVVDYERDGDQLNLMNSSAQEDNNVLLEEMLMEMVTKFTHEIEELKVSQLNQNLKIETLEQELVHSKEEIVELKKMYRKLECLEDEDFTSPISRYMHLYQDLSKMFSANSYSSLTSLLQY